MLPRFEVREKGRSAWVWDNFTKRVVVKYTQQWDLHDPSYTPMWRATNVSNYLNLIEAGVIQPTPLHVVQEEVGGDVLNPAG